MRRHHRLAPVEAVDQPPPARRARAVRVEEQVGQRAPALLAGVVGLDERGGAGGPRRRRDLAAVQQHDDDGRACIIHGRLYVIYGDYYREL